MMLEKCAHEFTICELMVYKFDRKYLYLYNKMDICQYILARDTVKFGYYYRQWKRFQSAAEY